MYDILAAFATALLITYFAIPSIIKIAHAKNLCDEPSERRSHHTSIPTLGGLGIFAGLIFSVTFWLPFDQEVFRHIQYTLSAYIIIFLIGAKDDIIPLTPSKKFIGQLLAAVILVYKGKIQLTSLYGVLGWYDIPQVFSVPLTVFTMLLITNALNLIDGINGLAATVGLIMAGTMGAWFYQYGRLDLAVLAAALTGSLLAFLRYNITPARIFMGDTGSLLIGTTASILAINFIELNKKAHSHCFIQSVPAVAIAILIIPLFDTLRVFTLRVLRGRSPFQPDRTHIHHLLLDAGLSHIQATTTLGLTNLGFIAFAYWAQAWGTLELTLIILVLASLLTFWAHWAASRRSRTKDY